ncbi:SpoIIE family protein phosphatase [Cuneatibacter caecimuris]|uniref:Stage II sporulation protein E n=1 Tax=Cuneatibacter caecimuris TaxID=1796618 RepID=A0A4Q7PPN9_9FIRM|nr:SpoIIE family protein phosphatase [Cuneatibacter caecimuris]RZT02989.1 stage II sporulation protein E [Cuneatibacter caecimuris]
MSQRRWLDVGRAAVGLAAAVLFIITVWNGPGMQMGVSVIETMCLTGVLLGAYRYGAGTGAVCGAACGVFYAVWTEDMAMLGILCILGVLAGSFRRLGKFPCALAYLAGAVSAGMLYTPVLLLQTMPAVLMAAVIFFMVPVQMVQEGIRRSDYAQPAGLEGSCGVLERRLSLLSDSLTQIAKTFSAIPQDLELGQDGGAVIWKNRYLESRNAVADQMFELSGFMQDFRDRLERTMDVSVELGPELNRRLRRMHLETEQLRMLEGANRRREVLMVVRCTRGRAAVRQLAAEVSAAAGRRFRPDPSCRAEIGEEFCQILLEEETAFMMLHGVARATREGEQVSGDCFSFLKQPGGKIFLGLCDGMGSGQQAYEESEEAIELAEQLTGAGFQPKTAARLVHTSLLQRREAVHPAAMDVAVVDLYSGLCDFVKAGAAATLIDHGGQVEIFSASSLPLGAIAETEPVERLYKLRDGDKIIMVTDGVLEALPGENKEEQLSLYYQTLSSQKPGELAQSLLRYVRGQSEEVRDDMTVLVAGIWKK